MKVNKIFVCLAILGLSACGIRPNVIAPVDVACLPAAPAPFKVLAEVSLFDDDKVKEHFLAAFIYDQASGLKVEWYPLQGGMRLGWATLHEGELTLVDTTQGLKLDEENETLLADKLLGVPLGSEEIVSLLGAGFTRELRERFLLHPHSPHSGLVPLLGPDCRLTGWQIVNTSRNRVRGEAAYRTVEGVEQIDLTVGDLRALLKIKKRF